MDRRKSLKVLALTTVSGGLLLDACKTKEQKPQVKGAEALNYDRTEE